jgi:uncharacterized protein with HEPN domain
MQRDARAFLWDIQQAADAIQRFVAGLDVRTYAETELVHSAVERKFEIIGEALNLTESDLLACLQPWALAQDGAHLR